MKFKSNLLFFVLLVNTFVNIYAQDNDDIMCSWANKGTVIKRNPIQILPFRYIDGYMFVDVVLNNKPYNFLFDTGAESTLIDKSIINNFDYKVFGNSEASGPLLKNQEIQTLIISKIEMIDLSFVNVGAIGVDLKFSESKFCNRIYGVIGGNIIDKAIWQIDYKNQIITIVKKSDDLDLTNHIKLNTLSPKKGWGTESVSINLDGHISDFKIDTGNGRYAIVSSPINYFKEIKNKKNKIIRYGINKSNYSYKIKINSLEFGILKLTNQILNLDKDVGRHNLIYRIPRRSASSVA